MTALQAAKTLPYQFQLQTTEYFCGPAATRVALSGSGLSNLPTQQQLATDEGTTSNGTDSVSKVTPVMDKYLGAASDYQSVMIAGNDASASDAAAMQTNILSSLDAGYGVVANIIGPIHTLDGSSYTYSGGHYVAVVGYQDSGAQFLIADVNVRTYWITSAALATWIAGRGYSYSAAKVAAAPAPVLPVEPGTVVAQTPAGNDDAYNADTMLGAIINMQETANIIPTPVLGSGLIPVSNQLVKALSEILADLDLIKQKLGEQ